MATSLSSPRELELEPQPYSEIVRSENKALLVNCLGSKKTPLFELILKEFTGESECGSHQCFLWPVENKYYSAKILLKCCRLDEGGMEVEHYEAIVMVFDCTPTPDVTCVDSVAATWAKISSQLCQNGVPAVCLLVAVISDHHANEEDQEQLQQVLQWCVENGFELIEWTAKRPQKGVGVDDTRDPEDEEESEVGGAARLAEALQAHVWPNITMKVDAYTSVSKLMKPSELTQTTKELATPLQEPTLSAELATSRQYLTEEEKFLAVGLEGEQDCEGESFEDLFAKFAEMKAHAQQLPHEERKHYAEKVVLAFWDAIGGDEDEVKDTTEP